MDKKQNMTNKALFGLVGGGSTAAGLGTGFGVGFNTQTPYKYENLMNALYSDLISKAEREIAAYKKMDDTAKSNFLYNYMGQVCGIVEDIVEDIVDTYKTEKANQRAKKNKSLCEKAGGLEVNKSGWESHFNSSAKDLREEWAEFKEYIYSPTNAKPQ